MSVVKFFSTASVFFNAQKTGRIILNAAQSFHLKPVKVENRI